ncbi:hypothetical protein V6N11_067348 [Hibiscus sabdariffa]|uniref:tRNA-uridine aminocarboxypropyltransferase n=1 Tax=Hibiscus sabdariffa TaxID=183260 RepID=A0ABR2SR41_9ROSI
MLSSASNRVFTFTLQFSSSLKFSPKTRVECRPRRLHRPIMSSASRSSPRDADLNDTGCGGAITLEEWQGWGCVSPVPAMVNAVIQDLKLLENNTDAQMVFGGNGGKLQGDFKVQEDKKHRAKYQTLGDSDKKFQFFSARQIACRLLGSRGYLCQKCWLPMEDCMCSQVKPCSLWRDIKFWLYMHPKDFLRQNNTGKLLWQVFGVQAATLCLYGISEDEELMWNAFKDAGKDKVWCLYPNQNMVPKTVKDAFTGDSSADTECAYSLTNGGRPLNFVLIDGTWSNSAAMFRRLKEQAKLVWGEEDLPCISLATGASAMHKLRPQPSWDRTCTAAAAIGVLSELQLLPECSIHGLDKQADAVEDALVVLLEALTTRRLRMGRSITHAALRAHETIGRNLLQAKKECDEDFTHKNYTILTSKCKGPQYPRQGCCKALSEFGCPFVDKINNQSTNCAATMFSYINLYGKYPPGLFSNLCTADKEGVICESEPPTSDTPFARPALLLLTSAFLVTLSHLL